MKRSGRLRAVSPKRRRLNAVAGPVRAALREECGRCEACGHSPENPWPDKPMQLSVLCIHEIGNGQNRGLCLDKRYATLCLCYYCNQVKFVNKKIWPVEKQLCLLMVRRPLDYCRQAFVNLIRPKAPNWITEADVRVWLSEIEALCNSIDLKPSWRE